MSIGFNCNGTCTRSLNESSPSLLKGLLNPIVLEETVRFEKEVFLFWEKHYFRMMATLRRMRFQIPNSYTPEKFILEAKKLIDYLGASKGKAFLFHFHFVREESNKTTFVIECEPLNFLESIDDATTYEVDLYRENFLSSGLLANQSIINAPIRNIARTFAIENGLDDVLLLNDQKQLVEATKGSLFLIQENKVLTPSLQSGAQNSVFRQVFIHFLMLQQNIEIIEKSITPFEIQNAKEIFILDLATGTKSIGNYRKTSFESLQTKKLYLDFLSSSAFNSN